MDSHNQHNTNPFGTYQYGAGGPNKPRDISSDLWTPISTGVPLQPSPKLQDENQTPPKQQPRQKRPTAADKNKRTAAKSKAQSAPPKRRPAQNAAASNKSAPSKRAAQPKRSAQPAEPERPVVRKRPPQPSPEQNRQRQRMVREDKSGRRQYEKSMVMRDNFKGNGMSDDEIRAETARRSRRKKRVVGVIIVSVVMVLAAVFALVYCYAFGFPISKITVTGKTDYTTEEIIQASGVTIGENMLRVHSRAVNEKLSAVLPYIQSAKVEYKLPDTLVLKVTQTKEKYLIVGKKSYLCLSEEGKVLSLKKKKVKDGQFRLEGFEWQNALEGSVYTPENENVQRFETAKQIVQELEKNELTAANVLQLETLHPLIIQYDGRINIYLNGTDQLSEKINLVAGILKNEISQNSQGYIDARFEGRAFFNEGSMSITG